MRDELGDLVRQMGALRLDLNQVLTANQYTTAPQPALAVPLGPDGGPTAAAAVNSVCESR